MKKTCLCLFGLLLCLPLSAIAKKDGSQGNPHARQERAEQRDSREERAEARISIGITIGEARDIARGAGISSGYYKPLPPGMRNRLAKGKPLPPGIAKQRPSAPMLERLPVHPGHEWLVIGVDLVLVNIRTRIPVDILPGIF